jgi:hypothetical protein
MNTQLTRRRRGARAVAVGVAVAALVATLGAGQALAVPDERILERQGMIDYHTAAIRQALAAEAVPDERILERQGKIGRQAAAG